jgi:predicted esterase
MKRLTSRILLSACFCALILVQRSYAQSIINPSDPVLEYDPAHPPTPPDYFHPLVKWVRTLNIANGAVQGRNPGWNSDVCKAYTYNGLAFRVQFPKTYAPTVNDGKKYPLIIFLHGQGENDQTYLGPPPPGSGSYNYDNQFHLLQGPPQFDNAIKNGQYDGYVLSPQLQNNVSGPPTVFYASILNDIMNVVKYMISNNKVDPFHIVVNGLSEGGVGTWEMLNSFPTYIAAITPMSAPTAFVNWNNPGNYFSSKRFTPIWVSQGGQDAHPTPAETQRVADTMAKYGGNFKESFYPSDAHNTWYNFWGESSFWPFINNAYSSNPWMIGGLKTYSAGQAIRDTIGLMAGFSGYQWRLNGAVISGATSNTLLVTGPGVYDARVQRDGIWSDWSHVPITITSGTSSTPPPTTTTFTRIEAENYTNMLGVQKENTTDMGGGQNVGYIDLGDWMDYSVSPSSSGTYAVNLRVSSPGGGQLQIKNSAGTVLATVTVPNTGGWQNWQTVSTNIALNAGTQTVRIYSASNGWNFNWWEISTSPTTGGTPPPPPPPPPPATGTIHIEAESYINMNGVQTETTTDVGGGQNVGYIDTGDWMDYSVNIASAGTFPVNLRLASPGGSQLQIRNSAGAILATVTIPATGGWQNWQTVAANITLPAGLQTLRLYASSNSWNLNWWEIGASGTTTTSTDTTTNASTYTHIEAENYATMNGVVKENTTDVGGGQSLGYIDTGDWMDYKITVAAAGTYSVRLRVASPTGGQLQMKNSTGTVLATVTVPNTGGWQNWQTVVANITLPAGSQTIRVYSASNGWNFNWWEIGNGAGSVTAASVGKAEDISASLSTPPLSVYPNPIVNNFQLQLNNELTGSVTVQVYDMEGSLQKQFSLSKPNEGPVQYYLSIGQLAKANYIVKVTMKNWTESKQIIKQ